MNGKEVAFLLTVVAIVLVVCIGAIVLAYNAPRMPPMSGYISGKGYHPESYPVYPETPWVRVLVISSTNDVHHCSWIVDEETYNLYEVGDPVTMWVRKAPSEEVQHEAD